MKIIRITGGLGNQMFQYALFITLKEKYKNEEVLLDCSYIKHSNVHTGLDLDRVFGVDLPQASFFQLLKLTRPVYFYKLFLLLRKILPNRKTECLDNSDNTINYNVFTDSNLYYDGYWQNYLYFNDYRDLICEKFKFRLPLTERNEELLKQITITQSVGIHIRRGDYLKYKLYCGICDLSYYQEAIKYIKNNVNSPCFFIFSNDINWCKENISPLLLGFPIAFVDWNTGMNSPLDMCLMSNCKHNIIANSSFSWWAAFLNPHIDKIICAPKVWVNRSMKGKIQMPDWKLF